MGIFVITGCVGEGEGGYTKENPNMINVLPVGQRVRQMIISHPPIPKTRTSSK